MNWQSWAEHFERNAQRVLPEVTAPVGLSAAEERALLRSLATFQLGEAGEGRIAHDIDQVHLPDVDDDFRRALKTFIREEGRHARVLGLMVQAMGGQLLRKQWTERAFVHVRRAFGVRFKLLVLLASEVIGIVFYGLMVEALRARGAHSFAAALDELKADEEHHLRFQGAFFRSRAPGWLGPLLRVAWWPLITGAVTLLLVDQRETFRAFGLGWSRLVRAYAERAFAASLEMTPRPRRPHRPDAPLSRHG
jgi:hypothetical protein